MKCAVLGHKGFIGSHMVEFLKSKGHSVQTVDGMDLRKFDCAAAAVVGCDQVYHFAANMGGVGYFSKEQYSPFMDNMQIDMNVIKACEQYGVKTLFYPSSACIYSPSKEPLSEWMLLESNQPDQSYGLEKLTITKMAQHAPFDMNVGILHTIYGIGQTSLPPKAKFPAEMAEKVFQSMKTGELEIWGDGNQTRTFLWIDDAIEMIYELTTNGYHVPVNISSEEEVTINDCVSWMCNEMGITPKIVHNLDKPSGRKTRGADMSLWKTDMRYRPKTSTEEGFRRLIKDVYARHFNPNS